MLDYDLTRAEQVRRTDLAQKARRMILSHMKVEAEDETSLTLDHRGYYMQISFSPLHRCWSSAWLRRSETRMAHENSSLPTS